MGPITCFSISLQTKLEEQRVYPEFAFVYPEFSCLASLLTSYNGNQRKSRSDPIT
jgi:hypothetical protein